MAIFGRFINENTPQTLPRKGSFFPPPVIARHHSSLNRIHSLNTPKNMTAHDAYREWFNDFLSTEYFAKYHDMTLEKARQLIREGREIEEQIEKLKQQHSKNENKKR